MILPSTHSEKELELFNIGFNADDISKATKVNINFDYAHKDVGFGERL